MPAKWFANTDFQPGLQIASVRAMYPEADQGEVFVRVAARRLGRDLWIKVYGRDPDLHP
jgi:hypothetical protein